MELKLKSSQWIVDHKNRIVMAEGRLALLEAIAETGSINQAAKLMKMSYKSAWSKIRTSETHLKTKIVHSDRSQGTRLTSAGWELLQKYKKMKQQCLVRDDAIFESIFHPAETRTGSMAETKTGRGTPPIISFVGHSGSGKTTFIEKLIPLLVQAGVKTAIIKHDVHGFEMDKPGKDTWRHKKAGAAATMISCACDEIVMGKHSAIGPIDPQITFPTSNGHFTAPAQSILDEFEEAKKEIKSDPATAPLWVNKINGLPHGFLNICQNTLKNSVEKVSE